MSEQAVETPAQKVVCPPTRDTAVRSFILAAIAGGFAIWCILDWPNYSRPDAPLSLQTLNDYAGWALNHFAPFILLPLAVVAVVVGLRSQKKVLVADEAGIGYEGRDKVAWSDVTMLDARKLKDKQILDLHHDGGRMRLDGLKLQNFRPLVAFIETHVPADKQQLSA